MILKNQPTAHAVLPLDMMNNEKIVQKKQVRNETTPQSITGGLKEEIEAKEEEKQLSKPVLPMDDGKKQVRSETTSQTIAGGRKEEENQVSNPILLMDDVKRHGGNESTTPPQSISALKEEIETKEEEKKTGWDAMDIVAFAGFSYLAYAKLRRKF